MLFIMYHCWLFIVHIGDLKRLQRLSNSIPAICFEDVNELPRTKICPPSRPNIFLRDFFPLKPVHPWIRLIVFLIQGKLLAKKGHVIMAEGVDS